MNKRILLWATYFMSSGWLPT